VGPGRQSQHQVTRACCEGKGLPTCGPRWQWAKKGGIGPANGEMGPAVHVGCKRGFDPEIGLAFFFLLLLYFISIPNSTQISGLKFKINAQSKLQHECNNILLIYLFIYYPI
jgi:hypothetical protein